MKQNIDVAVFIKLIKDLKYNNETNEYTFKNKKYKLADLKPYTSKCGKDICYFVNINEPSDLKTVIMSSGIPTFDGFNNISVDKKLRKHLYLKKYYKEVTYIKRHTPELEKEYILNAKNTEETRLADKLIID